MELSIAENLRILRNKSGYTLEEVAAFVNASRQSVSKWEMGETTPDIENCIKLASLYKVTLDQLIWMPISTKKESIGAERIFGISVIEENNKIFVSDEVLNLFDLKIGDSVLILADKQQGIAIVKCNDLKK